MTRWAANNVLVMACTLCCVSPCLAKQAHAPWALPTVKDYLTWKYQQQKHLLVKAVLSIHLKRRMTFEQLSKAVNLAVMHRTREWGLVLRFAILWMCSSARRNADMRGLTWRSMCVQEQRVAGDENPWVRWDHAEPC